MEDDVVMLAKAEALISIFFRPVFWSMRYSNLEYTCATTLGSRSTHAGESCGGDMNELSGRTIAGRCPQLADRSGDNGGWRGYGPLAGNSLDVGLYLVSVGGNADGKLSAMVACVDVCSSW